MRTRDRGGDRRGMPFSPRPLPRRLATMFPGSAWFDPSRIAQTDNSAIAAYADRNYNYALAEATNQATYKAGGTGGGGLGTGGKKPCVLFGSVGSTRLSGAAALAAYFSDNGPFTIIYRGQHTAIGGANQAVVGAGTTNFTSNRIFTGCIATTGIGRHAHDANVAAQAGVAAYGTVEATYTTKFSGSRWDTWINSAPDIVNGTASIADVDTMDLFVLGANRVNGAFNFFADLKLGHCLVITAAVNDTIRQAAEAWVTSEYP
ncbi:MAG: hypothetical protein QM778_33145 [Myxococcales bacterium]